MLQVSHVGTTLQNMQRGERAWFWFCQDVDSVDVPLVVVPLSKDPSAFVLGEIVGGFVLPRDAVQCVGLAHCDEGGRMHLGSGAATAALLPALARWVRQHLPEAPGLARLVHARVLSYDDKRVITGIWEDATLWSGISPLSSGGGLGDAAAVLKGLSAGEGAWFWASLRGPEGTPFLLLEPESSPAEVFARQVAAVRARCAEESEGVAGVLRVLQTGRVVLTTEDDLPTCRGVVAALAAHPVFIRLKGGVVLAKGAGGYSEGGALTALDHTKTAALLSGLGGSERLYFWLTESAADGNLWFEVDREQEGIKSSMRLHRGSGRVSFGVLSLLEDGRVELKAREGYAEALSTLASFVRFYQRSWPEFRILRRSRMLLEGQLIEDASLWTSGKGGR